MDEIRGSSSGRRLSQILDPITRLASDFGSNSAPCSPRLGARVQDPSSGPAAAGQSGPIGAAGPAIVTAGVSSSSRAGPSGAGTGSSNSGPDSPRLWPRQFRQAPTPPPRPRHAGAAATTAISTASTSTSVSTNVNNNNNNNNAGSGVDGGAPLSVIHTRDSPYVNVSNLFFHKDKSFAENARSAGYIELREKPKCSPYDFTSESSGHVEYADKRTFVTPVQSDLAYDVGKEPGSPLCRGRSNYDPGPSSGRSHFDRAFSFSGRQPSELPASRIYEAGRLFVDPRATGGNVDLKREKLDVRPTYNTSKSFDGYTTTVEELNWQERCLELQLELHRSRSQATRVRDMLREKVSLYSFFFIWINFLAACKTAFLKLLIMPVFINVDLLDLGLIYFLSFSSFKN